MRREKYSFVKWERSFIFINIFGFVKVLILLIVQWNYRITLRMRLEQTNKIARQSFNHVQYTDGCGIR